MCVARLSPTILFTINLTLLGCLFKEPGRNRDVVAKLERRLHGECLAGKEISVLLANTACSRAKVRGIK